MYCKYCGEKIVDKKANSCNKCGKQFNLVEEGKTSDKNRKGINGILIFICILVGIVVIITNITIYAIIGSTVLGLINGSGESAEAVTELTNQNEYQIDINSESADVSMEEKENDDVDNQDDLEPKTNCNMTIEWIDDQELGYGMSIELMVQNESNNEQLEVYIYSNDEKKFICDEVSKEYISVEDLSEESNGKIYLEFEGGYRPISLMAGPDVDRYEDFVMFFPVSSFKFVVTDGNNVLGVEEDEDYFVRYPTGWWDYEVEINWDNLSINSLNDDVEDNLEVMDDNYTYEKMVISIDGNEYNIPSEVYKWEQHGIKISYDENVGYTPEKAYTNLPFTSGSSMEYTNLGIMVAMVPGYDGPCVVSANLYESIPGNREDSSFNGYLNDLNAGRHPKVTLMNNMLTLGECYDFSEKEDLYGECNTVLEYDKTGLLCATKGNNQEWKDSVGDSSNPWYRVYSYRTHEYWATGDYNVSFTVLNDTDELVGFKVEYYISGE